MAKKKIEKKVKKSPTEFECSLNKRDFEITKHIDFDPHRYCLDIVYWDRNRWVVTDGRTLIIIEGKGIPEIKDPIMLDGLDMLEMFKRMKKHDTIESVKVAYNKVTFSGSGRTYDVTLKTEGSFPKYESVIEMNKKTSYPSMTVDAARLSKVLSYFPDFVKDKISSEISFDDQKIQVTCTDGDMTRSATIACTSK